jgi:hypothetical protein
MRQVKEEDACHMRQVALRCWISTGVGGSGAETQHEGNRYGWEEEGRSLRGGRGREG